MVWGKDEDPTQFIFQSYFFSDLIFSPSVCDAYVSICFSYADLTADSWTAMFQLLYGYNTFIDL